MGFVRPEGCAALPFVGHVSIARSRLTLYS